LKNFTSGFFVRVLFSLKTQKCDSLQNDNGPFIKFCYMANEGIDTQRMIGTSHCSCSIKRKITNSSQTSKGLFENMFKDPTENQHLVTLMIDDRQTISAPLSSMSPKKPRPFH